MCSEILERHGDAYGKGGETISETQALAWVMLAGGCVGAVFDFYRAFRKWSRWGRFLTFVGDILFSVISLAILFVFMQKANGLDLRLYSLWGSLLGLFIYLKLFSRRLVRFYLAVLRFISRLSYYLLEGLKLPFRVLAFLMRPPYALLRWFSMLFYRMAEALFTGPVTRKVKQARSWWDRVLPPRTKG